MPVKAVKRCWCAYIKVLKYGLAWMAVGIVCTAWSQSPVRKTWRFNDLSGWVFGHQDNNPADQCEIRNGVLRIYTRANSADRKKVHTEDKVYTTGRYVWKVYIPAMGEGDQSSIGAWIYCDDHHELDFEIGYGKEEIRKKMGVASDDLLVYMTSQDFPYASRIGTIKPGWHIFEMDLTLKDGNYFVSWIVDKKEFSSLLLEYGDEISFFIFCSVENLEFLGDHPAKQENYGLFDFVKYRPHD